jgi:hypothetical protein
MTRLSLLETALLLGVYVALAGSYGLVYAFARLQDAAILRHISVEPISKLPTAVDPI